MFDIQKFAEDETTNYGDVLDGASDEENLPPIPDELEGIPENIARDIMAKATEKTEPSANEPAPAPAPAQTSEQPAETSVPYQRFKDVIDQKGELEKQIAAYRERYGDISAPQAQPSQPQFNEQVISQIEDAITKRAMAISGMSKEDVENLDYIDESDPRISLWNHAKEFSNAAIYGEMVANHVAQQQELQRMQALQNQAVSAYNDYFAQKQATNNFDAIRQFATGEFFDAQSPVDKEIITDSFVRLNQNRTIPADLVILRDFFARAENAYMAKQGQLPTPKPAPQVNFPRTNMLQGSASGGNVTQAQLAEMLRTKKWSEIPPQLQKMLLGV